MSKENFAVATKRWLGTTNIAHAIKSSPKASATTIFVIVMLTAAGATYFSHAGFRQWIGGSKIRGAHNFANTKWRPGLALTGFALASSGTGLYFLGRTVNPTLIRKKLAKIKTELEDARRKHRAAIWDKDREKKAYESADSKLTKEWSHKSPNPSECVRLNKQTDTMLSRYLKAEKAEKMANALVTKLAAEEATLLAKLPKDITLTKEHLRCSPKSASRKHVMIS